MYLPQPFYRLPRRFNVERLRQEVAALPASAWAEHPNGIEGNTSCRLISADGGENDRTDGHMLPTPHLAACPYIRQVLASFGVPWSRSRLMRLAAGVGVPQHSDINYHWYYRVRIHIPVFTDPSVIFHCDGERVHMAAGQAWVFDNWRQHHVEHPSADVRIHLVADTVGNAGFWQMVGAGGEGRSGAFELPFDPARNPVLMLESNNQRPVMNPAELEMLVGNLRGDLVAGVDGVDSRNRLGRYHALLDGFVRDWRGLYALHGERPSGWPVFVHLRNAVRSASRPMAEGLVMRTNRVAAHQVLEGRVLRACLSVAADTAPEGAAPPPQIKGDSSTTVISGGSPLAASETGVAAHAARASVGCLRAPVFIVAAPRSGSTLLFETLATSDAFATVGGEAHWLVESIAGLSPGGAAVDSNRLDASHYTAAIAEHIRTQVLERLVDNGGRPVAGDRVLRWLEKTPKNALRVPFFDAIFPDARFILLWREPRGNLSSIIEAWRSGRWRTYPALEGFDPPWSLLLPPGWQAMRGRPLEELAAFQWVATNEILMSDLSRIDPRRWTAVEYSALITDPPSTVQRLCSFLEMPLDTSLAQRVHSVLPPARHTLTVPAAEKWRTNEAMLQRVLGETDATLNRLRALNQRQ